MTIKTKCKKCGYVYASSLPRAMGIDENALKNPRVRVDSFREKCPRCGQESTYNKKEFIIE